MLISFLVPKSSIWVHILPVTQLTKCPYWTRKRLQMWKILIWRNILTVQLREVLCVCKSTCRDQNDAHSLAMNASVLYAIAAV